MNFHPWQLQASLANSQWFPLWKPTYSSSHTHTRTHTSFPLSWRQARVTKTKPRSAGNSPTFSGRRHNHHNQDYQTNLAAAAAAATFGSDYPLKPTVTTSNRRSRTRSRPFSWHPSATANDPYAMDVYYEPYSDYPTATTSSLFAYTPSDMNMNMNMPMSTSTSTSTSNRYPATPSPSQMDQPQQPFDLLPWTNNEPTTTDPWTINSSTSFNNISPSPNSPISSSPFDIYQDDGGSTFTTPTPATPTPTSFLPYNQQFNISEWQQDQEVDLSTNDNDEGNKPGSELIGMGLYNIPGQYHEDYDEEGEDEEGQEKRNNGQGESSLTGMLGKGLKLEETFTPSSDNEDEEEEEEDDDEEEDKKYIDQDESENKLEYQKSDPSTNTNMDSNIINNPRSISYFFDYENNGGNHDDYEDSNNGAITGNSIQSLLGLTESQQFFNLGNNQHQQQSCMGYGYGFSWI